MLMSVSTLAFQKTILNIVFVKVSVIISIVTSVTTVIGKANVTANSIIKIDKTKANVPKQFSALATGGLGK